MASIYKTSTGYRAQVNLNGIRESATFRTKREAEAWASALEHERRVRKSQPGSHTLAQALERYRDEVSPTKRGERWEVLRINRWLADGLLPLTLRMDAITPDHIGAWRDARARQVAAGSVLREMGLLSAICETARREWRWVSVNPVSDVRKPRAPNHREVLITRAQIKAMLRTMDYSPGRSPRAVSHSVALAFLVALRTGMRAGELCGLTWDRVGDGYCRLPVTKTTPRDVPLEAKTMRLIERLRGWDEVKVFGLASQTLDALFRKYRQRAGLEGFTFHDARHTAATWMAQRLDVLTLCKMFGWRNPKQAMTYYNPRASDIARRLSGRG